MASAPSRRSRSAPTKRHGPAGAVSPVRRDQDRRGVALRAPARRHRGCRHRRAARGPAPRPRSGAGGAPGRRGHGLRPARRGRRRPRASFRRRSRCRSSLESARPASVRMPNSRPLSAIRMSGRSCPAQSSSAERHRREARPAAAPDPERDDDPAEGDQPERRRRPGGHADHGAAEPGDELGDADDVAHAEADDLERQPVEPERRCEDRDHRRRHHRRAHRRDREQVREEAVLRQRVEMEGRERRRRRAGDERGHRDAEHGLGEPPARRGLGHLPPRPAAQRLVDGDHRHRRGERHLEPGLDQALGREDEDDERGERDRAHGERRPVEQHRDQHRRRHHVGALRRHLGARDDQVGRPRRGAPPRPRSSSAATCSASARHQRQPVADDREDRRREQRHVQAGDRDDVVEVRGAQRRLGRAIDARAVAGQDRRGEGAVLARDPRLDVAPTPPSAAGRRAAAGRTGPAPPPRPTGSARSRPRRSARTRRPAGSRSRRAPTGAAGGDEPRLAEQAQPGLQAARPASPGRARRGCAPASGPARGRRRPRGRAAPAAGRSAERSRPITRPSTFAVISCGSTGAATIRLRSAAAAKPTAGRSTSSRSTASSARPGPACRARGGARPQAPRASRPRGSAGTAK